jgi:hypothetical protein
VCQALCAQFGADSAGIEQFDRLSQPITAPRQGLDVDAQGAQALHALPDGRAGLS